MEGLHQEQEVLVIFIVTFHRVIEVTGAQNYRNNILMAQEPAYTHLITRSSLFFSSALELLNLTVLDTYHGRPLDAKWVRRRPIPQPPPHSTSHNLSKKKIGRIFTMTVFLNERIYFQIYLYVGAIICPE